MLAATTLTLSACSSETKAQVDTSVLSEESLDASLPSAVNAEMVYEREGEIEVKARQSVGMSDAQTYKVAKVQAVQIFKTAQKFAGVKEVTARLVADGIDKDGNDSADFELFTITVKADALNKINFNQVGFDRLVEVSSDYTSTEK